MVPSDHCEICGLQGDDELILETPHWRTLLSWNQQRLGTCLTVLREHKRSLLELTNAEWKDWAQVLHSLHPAIYQAFGATNINVACLMNGAYEHPDPQPHVHWWSIPRYDQNIQFGGEFFEDEHYPHLTYELDEVSSGAARVHRVSPAIQQEIIDEIRKGFGNVHGQCT